MSAEGDVQIRAVLQEELDRLDRELSVVRGELSVFAGGNGPEGETERADEIATEHVERANDLVLLGDLESQLLDVQAALDRLDAGRYGECAACGVAIPAERLDAIPWARACVLHA